MAWVIATPLPPFARTKGDDGPERYTLDHLQLYGEGQLAFVDYACPSCHIDLRFTTISGDHIQNTPAFFVIDERRSEKYKYMCKSMCRTNDRESR